jgi:hypothetical protein
MFEQPKKNPVKPQNSAAFFLHSIRMYGVINKLHKPNNNQRECHAHCMRKKPWNSLSSSTGKLHGQIRGHCEEQETADPKQGFKCSPCCSRSLWGNRGGVGIDSRPAPRQGDYKEQGCAKGN